MLYDASTSTYYFEPLFTGSDFLITFRPEPQVVLRVHRTMGAGTLTKRVRSALRSCGMKGTFTEGFSGPKQFFANGLRTSLYIPVMLTSFIAVKIKYEKVAFSESTHLQSTDSLASSMESCYPPDVPPLVAVAR